MTCTWTGKACGVNRWTRQGKGRTYMSPEYRAFKESLAWTFAAASGPLLAGPVEVSISLVTNFDIDNLLKPVLDSLQTAGVISNDNQVKELHVWKERRGRKGQDQITIGVQEAV